MAFGKINYKEGIKQLKTADYVLILVILTAAALIFFIQLDNQKKDILEIKVDGKLFGKYKLQKNQLIKINQGTILQIKDGRYRMLKSSCARQICVKQGWCKDQPIICVPQKLVISPTDSNIQKQKIITY